MNLNNQNSDNLMALKLQQGQIWKSDDGYIRIVHLERLEVGYKVIKNLKTGEGNHLVTSKKDFCRLLKSCTLMAEKPWRQPTGSPQELTSPPTAN